MYLCPMCRLPKLVTEDPSDPRADWVALGEVVCGSICHEKAYDMIRGMSERTQLQCAQARAQSDHRGV